MALSTYIASHNGERYKNFLNTLESLIFQNISSLIDLVEEKYKNERSSKANLYDVIEGLAGIGRYILLTSTSKYTNELLCKINTCLINMLNEVYIHDSKLPGWYISNANLSSDLEKELYPKGNFNYSLAHGISGILSLLSLSYIKGIKVTGQKETINNMVSWILNLQNKDMYGPYWEGRISLEDYMSNTLIDSQPKRESWCYGSPGISRAIYLGGKALNQDDVCEKSLEVFKTIFSRPRDLWALDSSSFCHGKAGFLQILIRMYKDTNDDIFKEPIGYLACEIIKQYDNSLAFGYHDIEPNSGIANKKQYVNKPGLLEGAIGVALSLMSLKRTSEPTWDSAFLIS